MNTTLKKDSLRKITKKLFEKAIFECYKNGITSVAPLGFSGEDIVLFGSSSNGRVSLIQVRNYSGNAELLITDKCGKFLFYGRFDVNFGVDFLANQYYEIFKLCKSKIETEVKNVSDFRNMKQADNCTSTVGFNMLLSYQNQHACLSK